MMLKISIPILLFLIIITISTMPYVKAEDPTFNYTYDCKDGVVYVVVLIRNTAGLTNITLPEDPGTFEESLTAINQEGTPLPVLAGGGEITLFLGNTTQSLQLSYIIYPTMVSNTYMIEIHPQGRAIVLLPINGSLVYASDSPEVYANYSRITLTYTVSGVYTVYYTSNEAITSQPVPGGTTSGTPSMSTTTSATSSGITSTTESSGTQTKTETTPSNWESSQNIIYIILGIVIIAILVLLLYYKSRGKVQGSEDEVELVNPDLDDRDMLILKHIERGGHNISSLAKETGLSKSVVWRRIKKLEEMGLIGRSTGIGKSEITLTDKGKNFLHK